MNSKTRAGHTSHIYKGRGHSIFHYPHFHTPYIYPHIQTQTRIIYFFIIYNVGYKITALLSSLKYSSLIKHKSDNLKISLDYSIFIKKIQQ